ncbi:Sarcosine oxidase beta subunit (EC [Olavius sp. associated proteobacterium Delta 1]|nr:Sarcosine oxidase beta subunit (EC [Olavius sp. associated proteobacterium Delta 1]
MTIKTYDVIIIGGGIMGSAAAYYLMQADSSLSVAVIERDPSYARASTTLSMSNVRIQFSLKENIQVSQYTFEILDRFEDEMTIEDRRPKIYYHRDGNLFLVDQQNQRAAEKAFELQKKLGCRIEWWSAEKIKQQYDLYEPGNLLGGTYGPDDGHIDAYAMLMAYKAKARFLGAVYLEDDVTRIKKAGGRVSGVSLASGQNLSAGFVVNCAGAWAAQIAATAGVELAVIPIKRQVFTLDTAVKPAGPLPLTVLPSGMYFRTETGGIILLGKSMVEDPVGFNFSWDEKRFMEILWPELAEFVPAFDRLKLIRGWAGLYAVNTLDGNAILGQWPEIKGFYLANGFSGHGLQQAPAVGRYLTELILDLPNALDLGIFSPARILEQKPLSEGGLV